MTKTGYVISKTSNAILTLLFILYSICCIAPLLLVIIVSFTGEKEVYLNGYTYTPQKFSLDAYRFVFFHADQVFRAYGVSFFVTIVGSIASLLVTTLLAYPLSRKDFRYRNFFTFYVFFHHAVHRRLCAMVYNLRSDTAPEGYFSGAYHALSCKCMVCNNNENILCDDHT